MKASKEIPIRAILQWSSRGVVLLVCFALGWWAGRNPQLRESLLRKEEVDRTYSTSSMAWIPDGSLQTEEIRWHLKASESDIHFRLLEDPSHWTEKAPMNFLYPQFWSELHPDFQFSKAKEQNVLPLFWRHQNGKLEIVVLELNPTFRSHATLTQLLSAVAQEKWIQNIPFSSTLMTLENSSVSAEKKASSFRFLPIYQNPNTENTEPISSMKNSKGL